MEDGLIWINKFKWFVISNADNNEPRNSLYVLQLNGQKENQQHTHYFSATILLS
jgi:hypothetical protein